MEFPGKHDSDSAPSDDEKVTGVEAGQFESLGHGELPPDPDAGLSEAEKKEIARYLILELCTTSTNHCAGQEAPLEARHPSHSLALSPLPH